MLGKFLNLSEFLLYFAPNYVKFSKIYYFLEVDFKLLKKILKLVLMFQYYKASIILLSEIVH